MELQEGGGGTDLLGGIVRGTGAAEWTENGYCKYKKVIVSINII